MPRHRGTTTRLSYAVRDFLSAQNREVRYTHKRTLTRIRSTQRRTITEPKNSMAETLNDAAFTLENILFPAVS